MDTGEAVSYRQLALPAYPHHRHRLAARHHTEPLLKDAWMGSTDPVRKARLHQQQVDEALQQELLRYHGYHFSVRRDVSPCTLRRQRGGACCFVNFTVTAM